jgi:hypothetical protein
MLDSEYTNAQHYSLRLANSTAPGIISLLFRTPNGNHDDAACVYEWMCTSVVPLRCQVASSTPQRPHLCVTSFRLFTMYGMQHSREIQQRPSAQALGRVRGLVHGVVSGVMGSLARVLDLDQEKEGETERDTGREEGKGEKTNSLCRVPRLKRSTRHAPLPTRRTIRRRRSTPQTRNRRRILVHGARLLLRRHTGRSMPRVRLLLRLIRLRLRLRLLRWRRLRLRVHRRR